MLTMKPGFQPYNFAFPTLSNTTPLRLDSLAQPLFHDNGHVTGFHCLWRDIIFEPHNVHDINAVVNMLKPDSTINSLVMDSGLDLMTVQAMVMTFYELGIIAIKSDTEMPAAAFYQHATARLRAHRHRILQDNPLLSLHREDSVTKTQLLGYLIEAYHFTSAAPSHISLAITQAGDRKLERALSQYISDKSWQGNMLALSIDKAGVSKDTLEAIAPTFPILGIINFLRHIARTDLQAYGLCIALTEGHTSPAALLAKQDVWEAIKAMDLVPDETLDVFYEHDIIDHNAKHDEVPEIIFPQDQAISPTRQQQLFITAKLYIDMIGDAYQALKLIYANPDCSYWFERA